MKDKYYVPTIEEFHVGFEYEWYAPNSKWETMEVETIDDINLMEHNYLYNDRVRVKYLSREDIESLGLEYERELAEGTDVYNLNRTLTDLTVRTICKLAHVRHGSNRVRIDASIESRSGFTGTIKNKSELKRILVMLGVVNETNA